MVLPVPLTGQENVVRAYSASIVPVGELGVVRTDSQSGLPTRNPQPFLISFAGSEVNREWPDTPARIRNERGTHREVQGQEAYRQAATAYRFSSTADHLGRNVDLYA